MSVKVCPALGVRLDNVENFHEKIVDKIGGTRAVIAGTYADTVQSLDEVSGDSYRLASLCVGLDQIGIVKFLS